MVILHGCALEQLPVGAFRLHHAYDSPDAIANACRSERAADQHDRFVDPFKFEFHFHTSGVVKPPSYKLDCQTAPVVQEGLEPPGSGDISSQLH